MGWKKSLLIVLVALGLSACGEKVLYEGLSKQEANKIANLLHQHEIPSSTLSVEGTAGRGVTYTVQVPQDKLPEATQLLQDNNLPREREPSFVELCGGDPPIIPTPEYEKCRSIVALRGSIINSLKSIPGVLDASVVLNIPEKKAFDTQEDEDPRPSASAVIELKSPDLVEENLNEARFQRFIANSVAKLDPRDVTVILTYYKKNLVSAGASSTDSPPACLPSAAEGEGAPALLGLEEVAGLQLAPQSVKTFKIYGVVFLLVLMGVSAALIINVLKMTKLRQELKVAKGLGSAPLAEEPLLSAPEAPALPEGEPSTEPSPESPSV